MINDLEEMTGKILLVDLTEENAHGIITRHKQYYSTVVRLENDEVIVKQSDMKYYTALPAIPEAYDRAIPGAFDPEKNSIIPDYTCMFIVKNDGDEEE